MKQLRYLKVLFWKDLQNLYNSLSIYLLSAFILFVSGLVFFNKLYGYAQIASNMDEAGAANITFSTAVLAPLSAIVSFMLIFVAPLITMKLFSEEKKMGTLELLFTYPISDFSLVAAKYLVAVVALLPAIFVSVLLPLILLPEVKTIDWGYLISGFLGVLLFLSAASAIGIWSSSLTDNQLAAGGITLILLLTFWMIGLPGDLLQGSWREIFHALSFSENLHSFVRGAIELKNLLFFVGVSSLFFYLTYYNLSARNWRS